MRQLARRKRGFSLLISLLMMVLLATLALGLLGLSSITLRASAADQARQEARANSRLALMLAIGQLQKNMGPDQSISARSSAINGQKGEMNALGAWESWHWKPTSGSPTYTDKAKKFRGWLVSTPSEQDRLNPAYTAASYSDPVWLINPSTVGTRDTSTGENGAGLRAQKVAVTINQQKGNFAYAVMDESQKATINLPETKPADNGAKLAQRTAPQRPRVESVLPELAPATVGEPRKLVSVNTASAATGGKRDVVALQGDVTVDSLGLLTNAADGGLRVDFTTLFEGSSNGFALNSVLGGFGPYGSVVNLQPGITATDSAMSWEYLASHYRLYKGPNSFGTFSGATSGEPLFKYNSDPASLASNLKVGNPSSSGYGNGAIPSPAVERLLPVISKFQLMYSAVTHWPHITDRVNYYNTSGQPQGYQNYYCPHLVYDPVVTLYNPYDVALELPQLRVRIWDAPVLFGFQKNGVNLRNGFASAYQPLSRFYLGNERKDTAADPARKSFTLLLREMNGSSPGKAIRLAPGEVRVFGTWVQPGWTWGVETAGQYTVGTFFDFDTNQANNWSNKDKRTNNQFGVETVPGWDARAGFQTDHIASTYDRPAASVYSWDTKSSAGTGWVVIKKDDTLSVHAEAGRPFPSGVSDPDFQLDLYAGVNATVTSDTLLRSYSFKLKNPATELALNGVKPVVDRLFKAGDIFQSPTDQTVGGKTPFAIFTMAAKTTGDTNDNARPWVSNHPVVDGSMQDSNKVANALDSYDLTLNPVTDFNQSPGIEIEPGTYRGFYGASVSAAKGVSNVPMFHVPVMPTTSLGDLVSANLVPGSVLPRVTHAFGNSRAHPLLPSASVLTSNPMGGNLLDHSYFLNDALWDRFFFSTVGNFNSGIVNSGTRVALLKSFLSGEKQLLNPRYTPLVSASTDVKTLSTQLDQTADAVLCKKIAANIGVRGAFNVNSDSVPAWIALISSLRDASILGWANSDKTTSSKTGFPRFGLPIAGAAEDSAPNSSVNVQGALRWAGFRSLNDDQIKKLATTIVTKIRERGKTDQAPFLTLGEFVNRRVASTSDTGSLAGVLQQAIDESGVNDSYRNLDSRTLTSSGSLVGLANGAARSGYTNEGAPTMLTQGDLLSALAPVITVRGDTFRIRAYGESLNKDGTVAARAWCEAVVQRMPSYVDPKDAPEILPASTTAAVNKTFGRRFEIVSFRWLEPKEV
ncbi:hypothetical protein [Luteolibacter sp. LG18]|uniref:hypothetical protein n=1 Tax=Luteolibacter sp. LG18 TaxID=2819286 RepID=UPI002B299005|nr:hypothetical protein llg_27420 [Luteolibacter sp. LG18]